MVISLPPNAHYIYWRSETISRLVLGTAQLGLSYGIANTVGQPDLVQTKEIVAAAWEAGLTFFDTAQAYGQSETILGQALQSIGRSRDARIITKLSPDLDPTDGPVLRDAIEDSLNRLQVPVLWGLLLHRAGWLSQWDGPLGRTLLQTRDNGLVRYLGVSTYTPEETRIALNNEDIDLVQAPANVWDQRLLTEGLLELAAQKNKLIFVRSIYLQGLLAMPLDLAAARLPLAAQAVRQWHSLAASFNLTPAKLAARFALSLETPLVIGMESVEQIHKNAELLAEPALSPEDMAYIRKNMEPLLNSEILDPSQWKVHPVITNG